MREDRPRKFLARRFDTVVAVASAGIELDPSDLMLNMGLGWELAGLARYDEAAEAFRQAATVAPGAPVPRGYLGWVLGLAGKMEEADAILEDLERRRDRGYFSAWLLAHVHLGLGQNNEAITWLEKAIEEHDGILSYANLLYTLDPLRSDPRLQSLLKKMNFPSASAEGPSSSA